jgi:hypothetical protein
MKSTAKQLKIRAYHVDDCEDYCLVGYDAFFKKK